MLDKTHDIGRAVPATSTADFETAGTVRPIFSFPLPNSPFPLQKGFTLIELIIAIVVIGAAVGGVMLLVANVAARSVDPMIQTQAVYVAQSYLEEALLRPYDGPADCAGPRDQWQGVAAYDCINGQTPTDQQGNGLPGLSAYRVTVNVSDATLGGVATRRVEVQVRHTAQPIDLRLSGHRAAY